MPAKNYLQHCFACQGLPLSGDGDEGDSTFVQLMKARGEDDTKLLEWMKKKTNKYTCADMQNEILKVIAFKILREIAKNIKSSAFFSIMADKTTDKSNREQVVIVIRHVDTEQVAHEDFIGLNMVDSIDATTRSRAGTFKKFYQKPILDSYAHRILSSVSSIGNLQLHDGENEVYRG